MKKYYSVTTSINDRLRVSCWLNGSTRAEKKPETMCVEGKYCDVYTDWFNTKREAQEFVIETLNEN